MQTQYIAQEPLKSAVRDASHDPIVQLHPDDDVVIARRQLVAGLVIGNSLAVRGLIPAGHKLAVHTIEAGAPVRRYGQ